VRISSLSVRGRTLAALTVACAAATLLAVALFATAALWLAAVPIGRGWQAAAHLPKADLLVAVALFAASGGLAVAPAVALGLALLSPVWRAVARSCTTPPTSSGRR
jgi:hypothetical protein